MGRYRFDEMNDLLRKLGNGETADEAVRQAFGSQLTELEDEWHRELR